VAGDWIKMRGNLWDDPRVSALVDATDSTEAAIIGGLYWLWATADQHTEDGCMPGLTLRQIDRKTGIAGFGAALVTIGWLRDDPQGVVLSNFTEHNGTSAKRRCTDAQRKANDRNVSANNADKARTVDGQEAPKVGAREEKRRVEKKKGAKAPLSADKLPPWMELLVKIYHEVLPELPGVRVMDQARNQALRDFWDWILTSTRPDGTRRATNADEALVWARDYMERARNNDFIMGRGPKSPEHQNWVCSIEFLLSSRGMKKVLEETKDHP